jgi:hypothetical protein
MGRIAVKAQLESVTGIVADRFVHDYEIMWDGLVGPSEGDLEDIAAAITNFYNDAVSPATAAMGGYLSKEVSRASNACSVVIYTADDISDPLGSPKLVSDFTMVAGSSTSPNLPAEDAVALSYNADVTDVPEQVGNTRPAARRRGRLFFGPLNAVVLGDPDDQPNVQRPDEEFVSNMLINAVGLYEAIKAIEVSAQPLHWAVFSPTETEIRPIVRFSVDNAFDTIRKRGAAATSRTAETVTP